MYINSDRISIDQIVDELYDFSRIGALSIPDFLSQKAIIDLFTGAMSARKLFTRAKKEVGKVTQEMENLYVENIDHALLNKYFLTTVTQFKEEYGEVYKRIAEKAEFSFKEFNSFGFNYYATGSAGITPHRDFKSDENLVSIFVIEGNAPFFVCRDYEKTDSRELNSSPGSLILLRAARNKEEQQNRPIHYVAPCISPRLTAVCRYSTPKN